MPLAWTGDTGMTLVVTSTPATPGMTLMVASSIQPAEATGEARGAATLATGTGPGAGGAGAAPGEHVPK